MNATQAENLRILIRHMEGVTRTLNMDGFFNKCGTPACAYGEACMVPALQARGLHRTVSNLPSITRDECFFGPGLQYRLFGAGCINPWGRDEVTPQEWATEARKVLAENGYSMDDNKAWAEQKVRELVLPHGAVCF